MLSFALALVGILAPVGSYASDPGPSACANITSQLGSSKVVNNRFSLKYHESTEYWSTPQGDHKPACIVYPTTSKDVSTILQSVRAADSRFAVKGGGHNPNDFFSSTDKGVLIDLSKLNKKSYDSETTLATYEPGGVFGNIYEYFEQFNRTVVGARLSGVGTGLALGGGMSYLSPQYGMACDSFRELEIVLPNGTIVTASNTTNTDLFFASRGGGGNAYGIVTKYTVQSRPIGEFWSGNLIYAFPQKDTVADAIGDFIQYNTDPKAAIIGTYEKLPTPDINLNLDEIIIMFLVYDGPDPGTAFDNFTSIPHLLDTSKIRSYPEVVDMPIPVATEISRGNNIFRVGVHYADNDEYKFALDKWRAWGEEHKGKYLLLSLDYQPVPKSLTDASKAQGGNAMDMPDGPWFWLNYLLTTPPGMSKTAVDAVRSSFRDMVESTGNAEGLPLFINDASADQHPLSTFSTYSRLQEIKQKYDPDNFFADKTGGWSFE
ncbi:FAD-binding type 2 [Penicillium bovifimosum]|uniref:FAD-binding type 2 n=1 Tax=Penicillium bovifimosum TaxID=126998 RepID=A0A9W9GTY9_9EURO|nr:FAD-binding type 2 [Penicillium bovifimosum]KAJ5130019.1 FAD-binding type 2 [Penicillium bovifimosum]